jgi:branched-chain amino acid transport system permease protein
VSEITREPAIALPRTTPRAWVSQHRYHLIGGAVLLIVAIAYPNLVAQNWVDAMNQAMIAALGAIALNILLGVAGQLSLGSAAIMAVGSFTAGITSMQVLHLPFLATLALGAVAGGLVALILGVIALRVRGFYLVLATIALHYIVVFLAQKYQEGTVGVTGFILVPPDIFGWTIADGQSWYIVLLVILVVVTLASWFLLRSRTGRAFAAIKDRSIAASLLGVDVTRTKLLAFVVTSMLIGFQGALYAWYVGVVTYETFTIDLTVQFVAMIIIGGLASLSGSILGALFVTLLPFVVQALLPLLPAWLPFSSAITSNVFPVQSILYGLVIVIFMLRAPGGLIAAFRSLGRWLVRLIERRPRTATKGAARG